MFDTSIPIEELGRNVLGSRAPWPTGTVIFLEEVKNWTGFA